MHRPSPSEEVSEAGGITDASLGVLQTRHLLRCEGAEPPSRAPCGGTRFSGDSGLQVFEAYKRHRIVPWSSWEHGKPRARLQGPSSWP